MLMVREVTGTLVVSPYVREWCCLPYPDHPRGCPNYGHRETCPPSVALVADVFDLSRPHWFLIVDFDLGAHVAKMAKAHPQWSGRQCRCCLYWQGKPRAELRRQCKAFVALHPGTITTDCPEAMGVNVFRTCHQHDLILRQNPQETVYKVALVGYPRAEVNTGSAPVKEGAFSMTACTACTDCRLHTTRRHIVPGRGAMPADVVLIGEGPGQTEDLIGEAFVGTSGRLLDRMILAAGGDVRCYFTNIVLCHPCDEARGPNRAPRPDEVLACMPHILDQICLARPNVIVFVGAVAERYYRKHYPHGVRITHPAALARAGGASAPGYITAVRTLRRVFAAATGGKGA